ncbi:hypothetical protein FIBSPDRAFT_756717 [Athelia psychrophila]|uniref:BTB domain-containing protein n=1 Tax=Athelia psychrophila TaxID=1759441 RepID=A0A166AC35_9AGAM|nr:hypothetical protein FIBSPDRAFT_756717 [Fibularhizoctonia sp. CBS 109695]
MSGAEEPTNKRKRSEHEPHPNIIIVRSEFWLKDGNVILQAENMQFKVYRGILSLNSTVFSDMFSTPQPPSGQELIEGCPIVHLSDTSADVTIMLEAICQRRYVANGDALPFTVVAAFLRLGNKYDIEVLRADALKRLFYEMPSVLEAYEARAAWSMIRKDNKHTKLDMANLAREQNLLSALPIAWYRCCWAWHLPASMFKTKLNTQDAIICATSYVPLMKLQQETTFSWITFPPSKYPRCQKNAICRAARSELAIKMFFPVATLTCLERWDQAWGGDMCSVCVKIAMAEHDDGRRRFWEALPGIFGLHGWEELNKERDQSKMYVHIALEDRLHDR